MSMISDETVDRVREAADIVQIIGEHVPLRRTGADFRGPCPFHQGTHRNFSVSPRKGIYYCFVCHEGGDVFTFLQKRLGMDWPGAVRYVADKVGIPVEEVQQRRQGPDPRQPLWDLNAAAADWFRTLLWDDEEGRAARDYLALRRVSREVADRFGLGFAPRDPEALHAHFTASGYDEARLLETGLLVQREEAGGGTRARFRNRLMFPILDAAGNAVGFGGRLLGPGEPKYLNSAESPVFSKARLLYGLHMAKHAIRRDGRAMVVEGYFDVVRLVSAGFEWVVAPLGTALTEQQAALLQRYCRTVFLLYDSDRAGLAATFRAGDELLRHGLAVQVVTLPDGEDPDSFVDGQGGPALAAALGDAIDVFERKVQLLERAGAFGDLRRTRRALDRLLPTIRATQDPITRDLYIARASAATHVSRDVLERELAVQPATAQPAAPAPEARQAAPRMMPARRPPSRHGGSAIECRLVWVLIHAPALREPVGEQVGAADFANPQLGAMLTALVAGGPDADAAGLADQLDDEARPLFLELLEQPPGEGFDAAREAEGCVARVRAAPIERRLREIQRELPIAPDDAAKDALIREKQHLHRERAALGTGRLKSFDLGR